MSRKLDLLNLSPIKIPSSRIAITTPLMSALLEMAQHNAPDDDEQTKQGHASHSSHTNHETVIIPTFPGEEKEEYVN